jgi:hypothetical protein
MNQEPKQLPVPSLNPEQVKALMNYANEQIPMKYGKGILTFIESVALENEKASQTEENKAS